MKPIWNQNHKPKSVCLEQTGPEDLFVLCSGQTGLGFDSVWRTTHLLTLNRKRFDHLLYTKLKPVYQTDQNTLEFGLFGLVCPNICSFEIKKMAATEPFHEIHCTKLNCFHRWSCFLLFKNHVIRYCEKVYERSGKNLFWSIINSSEVLNKLNSRGFYATSLSTYDFSTLYTTLPPNLIKEKIINLIEWTFKREGSPYIACNDRQSFFTSGDTKRYKTLVLSKRVWSLNISFG